MWTFPTRQAPSPRSPHCSPISIKNIGIIHNREFEEGVLRVEFYDQTALDEAVTLLQSLHYSVYPRK